MPKAPATVAPANPLYSKIPALTRLFDKLQPVPDEWLASNCKPGGSKSNGYASSNTIPCKDYQTLRMAWRRAFKWTDGLDRALVVMLATVTSTKSVGDPLWVKVMAPASCLHGDTPIYDPVLKATKTVRERWREGLSFSVYTLKEEGDVGVATALPPLQYAPEPMYRVTFASGREIKVTGGHRFWNGSSYVALCTIGRELLLSSAYPLPSISDTALLARTQDALRCSQTAEDWKSYCYACSYPYGEQPPQELDTALSASPLLSGVPALRRNSTDARQEPSRKCTPQSAYDRLPSNYHAPRLASLPQYADESSLLPALDTFEQYRSLYLDGERTPLSNSHLPNRYQSSGQFELYSSDTRNPLPPPLESCRRGPAPPLELPQYLLELVPDYIAQHSSRSSLETNLVSAQVAVLPPLCEDTFELTNQRLPLASRILRSSFRSDKVRRSDPVSPDLTAQPLQDSYPIRLSNLKLGPLSLADTDSIVKVEYVGDEEYYDFHVPETRNYWALGVFNHNTGKSSLCEAISTNEEYVIAKSTLRGFHSGWQEGQSNGGSPSLIDLIRDKTFVIKDGDTLIQQPNLKQILSEARDIFDKVSRTHYRTGLARDHSGINMSWILCGTASLRILDSSELGQRFLDCVIMEAIDDDLEDEILWRVANRTDRTMGMESNGDIESQHEPDMLEAMRITGGYVTYLRENATALLNALESPDWAKKRCARLGKFVAYMRARPSKIQDEASEREFAARLVSQHVRLMKCAAVVLNKATIDEEVINIVNHVALDTSRGSTLDIVRSLYKSSDGMEVRAIALLTNVTEDKTRATLRYLRHIGVIEINTTPLPKTGAKTKTARWVLTPRLRRLYQDVMAEAIRTSEAT